MAESQQPISSTADGEGPQLMLQNVYLKDCSFESPNGPRVDGNWNPEVSMDLQTGSSVLEGDLREVLLTITVKAQQNDKPVFLVEVKQAGSFLMRGLTEADSRRAVASVCPTVLFPYARAVVSHLVSQGGFPQFLLPAVNFENLYANSVAQAGNATRN
ncbi:MAG: protein-export chaperone SecB [Steroidobacteraceae bacterium]